MLLIGQVVSDQKNPFHGVAARYEWIKLLCAAIADSDASVGDFVEQGMPRVAAADCSENACICREFSEQVEIHFSITFPPRERGHL